MQRFVLTVLSVLALCAPPSVLGQSSDRLNGRQAAELMDRITDLLEATRIVIPELSRAGAPLQENFRQGVNTLRTTPSRDHTGVLYRMLTNAKAYLQLSDTLPKSAEFSEDIARQLSQLREGIQRFEAHFRATLALREEQVLGSDRDNLRRYADANRMVGAADPSNPRVVFLGDSITDGWRLNQYFAGKAYLNRGISGQITGQMLGRTKPDVIDLQPSAMVLLGGTNDLARGVPDAAIRHNLEAIGVLAEAAGIIPVMASILPVSDYHKDANPRFLRTPYRDPTRIMQLNRWLAALCKSKGWGYLNYHDAMVDEAGRLRQDLANDGLHPNTEGYKVMAPLAEQAIQAALLGAGSRRGRR